MGGTLLKIGFGALLGVAAVGMVKSMSERSRLQGATGSTGRRFYFSQDPEPRQPRLGSMVGTPLDRVSYPLAPPQEWSLLMSRQGYRFFDEETVSAMSGIQRPRERSADLYYVRPSEMGITEPAPWSAIYALLRTHGYERCKAADGPAYLIQLRSEAWSESALFVMVVGPTEPIVMVCRQATFGIKILKELGGLLSPNLPLIVRRPQS